MSIKYNARGCVFIIVITALIGINCEQTPSSKNSPSRKIAEQYCQSCHLFPEPDKLDLSTWKYTVLPNMAERMGIEIRVVSQVKHLKELDLFPSEPVLTFDEWKTIKDYYLTFAPIVLPRDVKRKKTQVDTSLFLPKSPKISSHHPFVSLIKIDTASHTIYYGNANLRSLYALNPNGQIRDSIVLDGAPTYLNRSENSLRILTMGQIMPHDRAESLYGEVETNNKEFQNYNVLLSGLLRASDADFGDLNGDGSEDFVIASFGNNIGKLTWHERTDTEGVITHELNNYPGMIQTEIVDFDKNGSLDILALAAQGDERLLLYRNSGNGKFDEEVLLRFPPTYGSVSFSFGDITMDGISDILFVNGDNGDYKPISKNYHGIRIFEGSKKGNFSEILFLPMNGAFKAIARDYDQDGDQDIAAISYFPDYPHRPEEAFIFFKNEGALRFTRSTFPNCEKGKWLVMDAGDIDQDGDDDLVLGSALFFNQDGTQEIKKLWSQQPSPVLILENKLK